MFAGEEELNGWSDARRVPAGGFGAGVVGSGDGVGEGDFVGVGFGDFVGFGLLVGGGAGVFVGLGFGVFGGFVGRVVGLGVRGADFVAVGVGRGVDRFVDCLRSVLGCTSCEESALDDGVEREGGVPRPSVSALATTTASSRTGVEPDAVPCSGEMTPWAHPARARVEIATPATRRRPSRTWRDESAGEAVLV